jgi:hypothetical protein
MQQKVIQTAMKKAPEVPVNPAGPHALTVDSHIIDGSILLHEKSKVSPVLALGDAIARWEDAMLKMHYSMAAEAAFDVVWLARECELRRGDAGYDILQLELKTGRLLDPPSKG